MQALVLDVDTMDANIISFAEHQLFVRCTRSVRCSTERSTARPPETSTTTQEGAERSAPGRR